MEISYEKEKRICNETKLELETSSSSIEFDLQQTIEPLQQLKNSYDRLENVSLYWNYNLHKKEKILIFESDDSQIYKFLPLSDK